MLVRRHVTDAIAARPVNHNLPTAVRSASQNPVGWNDMSDELKALIVLTSVKNALARAQQTFNRKSGFLEEDGPDVIQDMCAAVSDLFGLKLTDMKAYQLAISTFGDVVDKLRDFIDNVKVWRRRNPGDTVEIMCFQIETLIVDKSKVAPPLRK